MAAPRPIGTIYNIAPQPPDAANTRWIPAGVLVFGVEYRDVSPADLSAAMLRAVADLEGGARDRDADWINLKLAGGLQ